MKFIVKSVDDYEQIECMISNECVGYINYKIMKKSVWLNRIRVEKIYRNRGIGKALLRIFENEVLSHYRSIVEGKFFPEDEEGKIVREFYESNGYKISKEGYETEIYKVLNKKPDLGTLNIEYLNKYAR